MLSQFGMFCRKLRIDKGELLKDMAEKLDVTSSYLSAVENGKRSVPQEWVDQISNIYTLGDDDRSRLKKAAEASQQKLDLKDMQSDNRNLVMALAREFNDLKQEDIDILKQILLKKK